MHRKVERQPNWWQRIWRIPSNLVGYSRIQSCRNRSCFYGRTHIIEDQIPACVWEPQSTSQGALHSFCTPKCDDGSQEQILNQERFACRVAWKMVKSSHKLKGKDKVTFHLPSEVLVFTSLIFNETRRKRLCGDFGASVYKYSEKLTQVSQRGHKCKRTRKQPCPSTILICSWHCKSSKIRHQLYRFEKLCTDHGYFFWVDQWFLDHILSKSAEMGSYVRIVVPGLSVGFPVDNKYTLDIITAELDSRMFYVQSRAWGVELYESEETHNTKDIDPALGIWLHDHSEGGFHWKFSGRRSCCVKGYTCGHFSWIETVTFKQKRTGKHSISLRKRSKLPSWLRTKIDWALCRRRTREAQYLEQIFFWWLANSRSQSLQWGKWILKQFDAQSWYKIWSLSEYNLIRAKRKLHRRRRGFYESFSAVGRAECHLWQILWLESMDIRDLPFRDEFDCWENGTQK